MQNSNLSSLRLAFPILNQRVNGQPLIYLDNAATTQKPNSVIQASSRYYQRSNANVHRAAHALSADATAQFEAVREQVAQFINAADPREVIWTSGTTASVNLVANSWGSLLQQGDEIILSELEHHANIVPWQLLAQRTGVRLIIWRITPEGDLDLETLQRLITPRTRLVAVTHLSNAIGTLNPVKQICEIAHQSGALVLIDGAQAVAHHKVDVQAIGCDFYLFSAHKLYGPTGVGVLWAKRALLEAMPPWLGGGEMIQQVSFEETSFAELPFKFEAGTPNIAGVIGLGAALSWLNSQDTQGIQQHEVQLLNHAIHCCGQIKGFTLIAQPQQRSAILPFTLKQHPQDVALLLDQQGIAVRAGHHCAMPLLQALNLNGLIRASFAAYNSLAEVERFAEVLEQIALSDRVEIATSSNNAATAEKTQQLMQQCLTATNWHQRYPLLMQLSQQLPSSSTELKQEKFRINGCESSTWVRCSVEQNGCIQIETDSEARIIRSLLALLTQPLNGLTEQQAQQYNLQQAIAQLQLIKHLSPSRGNGLTAAVAKIERFLSKKNNHP